MRRKIVNLLLVILLLGVVVSGCYPTEKINELEAQIAEKEEQRVALDAQVIELDAQAIELEEEIVKRETQIVELEGELAEASAKIEEQETLIAQIAVLKEEVTMFELSLEELRAPALEFPPAKVAGFITYEKTYEVLKKNLTKCTWRVSAYTKGPYHLTSVVFLKAFLDVDPSDRYYKVYTRDGGDSITYTFKERWIQAGLPPWSLGRIKVEREVTVMGLYPTKMWVWRCLFLTIEDGEYVLYEVSPQTDEVIRVEEPIENCHAEFSDRL